MTKHLATLGFGYTAAALARRLDRAAWRVTGSSRTAEGAAKIESEGYVGVVLNDETSADALASALSGVTHILLSASPNADGDPVLGRLRAAGQSLGALEWIGYLSTIGVYGDHQGAWVDETTPPDPAHERGRRRLVAEEDCLAFGAAHNVKAQVFRLPGIYGPGRSIFERLQAGNSRRIIKPGQVFNRMHVDDIAGALEHAMTSDAATNVLYNLNDDLPAAPEDAITFAAGLMNIEPPPEVAFDEAEMTAMARDFYSQNKRVSNARMKAELGYQLRYPTYREGLTAIWDSMK